jgi:hypothetical protein
MSSPNGYLCACHTSGGSPIVLLLVLKSIAP